MLKRIKARMQKVEIEKENKLKQIQELQAELKRLDGKASKLNLFKKEYEQLINRFNEFIKNEFIR